jgi:hypothetical protein
VRSEPVRRARATAGARTRRRLRSRPKPARSGQRRNIVPALFSADHAPDRPPVRGSAGNYLAFFGSFDYLERVAANRVIRTESDRGVVYLIDDRFARPDVQALLPRWWQAVSRSGP